MGSVQSIHCHVQLSVNSVLFLHSVSWVGTFLTFVNFVFSVCRKKFPNSSPLNKGRPWLMLREMFSEASVSCWLPPLKRGFENPQEGMRSPEQLMALYMLLPL